MVGFLSLHVVFGACTGVSTLYVGLVQASDKLPPSFGILLLLGYGVSTTCSHFLLVQGWAVLTALPPYLFVVLL